MSHAPATMQAVIFEGPGRPLRVVERPVPRPAAGQLLLRVHACAVCRTDLHLLDGEVAIDSPPRVLGHQIVATVLSAGEDPGSAPGNAPGSAPGSTPSDASGALTPGARVGVPWLGYSDGECAYCLSGRENLCPRARFTGRDIDGGFAQYTVADARYCFELPVGYDDEQVAPLLCAGLIGYRSLRMCGDAQRVGLYGFGASAHIIAQVCTWQGREVYAFTRGGDEAGQAFARTLGSVWVGSSEQAPPQPLDAAIIFAPVGALVPHALRAVAPGGTVVCAGIHMSDIPSIPYSDLWEERTLRSVANLTRADAREFLQVAPQVPVRTSVSAYRLQDTARALQDLREGNFTGAAVVTVDSR